MRNHSKYHAFNIKKEKGEARFRGKRYLFEEEWIPAPGIRLLREGFVLRKIDVAPFRIEKLNLQKVFQDLQRYFATLSLEDRMTVQNSWERLRSRLETLPNTICRLPKMDLLILPKQDISLQAVIPEHLGHIFVDDPVQDLEGETFPDDLDEGDFNQDIKEGLDVLIYSDIKKGRPWVGRIKELLGTNKFRIHWYKRRKGNEFVGVNNSDGSPYTSDLDNEMVILWNFSTRLNENSFSVSKFFLDQFKVEYDNHDSLLKR